MANDELPREVSDFIISFIDSVEQLNVLLLLQSGGRKWSVTEITAELRSTENSIDRRLGDLYDRQVLLPMNVPGEHEFKVFDHLRSPIALLQTVYRERPLRVIELIYSQPPMALRAFADAFRIRKDEK